MPQLVIDENGEIRHSDEINDIIATPPSWLLSWGTTSLFVFLALLLGLSAFIKYPDVVRTSLKITSGEAPRTVVTKLPGRLMRVLVKENQVVNSGQPMAYLESTANHEQVLLLISRLHYLKYQVSDRKIVKDISFNFTNTYNLGELQVIYQAFTQSLLTYRAAISNGTWVKKRMFLLQDLQNLDKQKEQLLQQKKLYQRDYKLASEEYRMNEKLLQDKAETPAEFREAESRYLSKQSPLIQNDAALITANSNYSTKQKDILELDNQMQEEKAKFHQALSSLISQADDWKNKYVLSAPQKGNVTFAGNIQRDQIMQAGQEVFYIDPGKENYFGEMAVPQVNMGKVKKHQEVLIKLRSYPFEEYGMLRGSIIQVNDVPYRDSVFFSRVSFDVKGSTDLKKPIHLKQGMIADAEIITENATILQRILRNMIKAMGN